MGGYLNTIQSFVNPRQIGFLIFYVTNRCNFKCDFCFYYEEIEKGLKTDELTIDQITRMAQKIGPLVQLSLTGGEPFLRKDLDQVTHAFIQYCDPRYITIPTNAWLTETMVSYIEEVLPRHPKNYLRLTFSIDGIGAQHDEVRSKPGSYKRIQESYAAISPLRKRFPNLVLDVNLTFTAKTEDTLLDAVKTLSDEFEFDNFTVTYARGVIKDPALKTEGREKYIEINTYLEGLDRRKEKRFLYPLWRGVRDMSRKNLIRTVFDQEFVTPCVAGRKLLVISETGEVLPCEVLGKTMGNLREVDYDVYRLLERTQNRELTDWIVDSKCKCSFECALAANVVWNPSTYPALAVTALKNIGRR